MRAAETPGRFTVIATSSRDVKLEHASQLGTAYTIDSRRGDLAAVVREIVGTHGVDSSAAAD